MTTTIGTEPVSLEDLEPFPGNARRGNVDLILDSLRANGQYKPLTVRRKGDDLIILAGNHTFLALLRHEESGRDACADWELANDRPCQLCITVDPDDPTALAHIIECDDATATRINLVDNKSADDGTYDQEALAALLTALEDDLVGSGFELSEAELFASGAVSDVGSELVHTDVPGGLPVDGDAYTEAETPSVPDAPKTAVTKRGDVWLLGPHRIMCGDCRDDADVDRLLNGAEVNLAFTSPPYASQRDYDEESGFKPVPPDDYVEWFAPVAANVKRVLADDGSWFVNIKEHCDGGQRNLYVKDLTLAHARLWGWAFVDEFAWTRSGVPGSWPNRFKNGWEPVFHFSVRGSIKFRPHAVGHASEDVFHEGGRVSNTNRTGNVGWHGGDVERVYGVALPSNVIHLHTNPAAMQGADHPAAYPVGLPQFFIRAYTDPGDTVYDPFMGSGSTLLAADREDRVAYGMEISPKYVDVICKRYQQVTGAKPVLERTGETHDFLANEAA
jgi:DNA modification methylase